MSDQEGASARSGDEHDALVREDEYTEDNPLPREIAPGVHWLGNCKGARHVFQGTVLHSYNSLYLSVGEHSSAIIEGGHPTNFQSSDEQLDELMAAGAPPVKYILPTHQEIPHCAGVGRLLERFPEAVLCGHIAEYHLVFPQYADRMVELEIGESVDLGGTSIEVVEAPFRDYIYTRWFLDVGRKVLFTADGFAYSHYHGHEHCGCSAEEAPDLALPEMTALYSEKAFWWTQHVDIEPYVERIEWLLEETGAKVLAPTHGLPVLDIPHTLPDLIAGLRMMPSDAPNRPVFQARAAVLGL